MNISWAWIQEQNVHISILERKLSNDISFNPSNLSAQNASEIPLIFWQTRLILSFYQFHPQRSKQIKRWRSIQEYVIYLPGVKCSSTLVMYPQNKTLKLLHKTSSLDQKQWLLIRQFFNHQMKLSNRSHKSLCPPDYCAR